jgi:sugar lactone lactonase YvrE
MPSVRPAIAAVVAAGALVLAAAPAHAGGAPPPLSIVAAHLDNPRGLAFAPDGALYVAESGKGGAGPCHDGAEGRVCFGPTGAVTRIAGGRQRRILTGQPSLAAPATGAKATGPSDVSVDRHGVVYLTVGLGGNPDLREQSPQLAGMAKLYKIKPGLREVADLGGYERGGNPDGVTPPDTNPNAVLAAGTDRFVVDAGGNSMLNIDAHGRYSTVATFGQRTVPGLDGKPVPMQAVPTSVVRGPDGALYVGELTGYPFPAGLARVWRIRPGHAPTVYATGFTTIIDLAFGPGGKLYVLEIAKHGLLSADQTGALIRVDGNGKQNEIRSTGLTAPGGLAIRGSDAYVSNCSVCAGTGSVVRVPLR